MAVRRAEWRHDSVRFVREAFGAEPDLWQIDALRAYDQHERIAMQACVGPGKSTVLAWIGWHFLFCWAEQGQHPNMAAISISGANLKSGLWKELAVWYGRSPLMQLLFEFTTERIFAKEYPKTWWLEARSYSKDANSEMQGQALSGLHAPYMAYLLDETGEMNPVVLRRAEQGLSNVRVGRIVMAGNPTSTSGTLYHAVVEQSKIWGPGTIVINGDPDDPKRSPRIRLEWAKQQIAHYGRDNPWVMSTILGKFPPGGLNTLLGPDEVREAMSRNLTPDQYQWAQKRIGVDVARFGDDRTVLFPRQGLASFLPVQMRHAQGSAASIDIGNRVLEMKRAWGSEMECFDDTVGWAHGAVDYCRVSGGNPLAVDFGSTKTNDARYYNRRSEMWMSMAEWIRKGGALPNVPELVQELTAPTYGFKGGKWILEDKDSIKDRLGYSPDLADALALTFATPDQPNGVIQARLAGLHQETEQYHPHARFKR
jgi:phage terminase large subunit